MKHSALFSELFAFQLPTLVNFVGGGGKTSLILQLAEEYSASMPVIYTTTTRIHPPPPSHGLVVIASDDLKLLKLLLERAGRKCRNRIWKFVVTRTATGPNLLRGVEPDFAQSLDRELFPVLLNEADGARSMSLKMPREGEPVLMADADHLVPVIGLDCLNKPLGPEILFRWELAAARHSLTLGQILLPDVAASLLMHPEGVCKDWRPGMRIVPYINKVDTQRDDALARELALALLTNAHFPVERVVWGSLERGRATSLSAAEA